MNSHDCVTWNAIISACALHGNGNKALCFFEVMKKERFAPDKITILAVFLKHAVTRVCGKMGCAYSTI